MTAITHHGHLAVSWGQYTQWAQHAANTGQPKLASLFTTIGAVELTDHCAKEANSYGLVQSVRANLGTSIAAETSAIALYTGDNAWAKKQHRTTLASDLSAHLPPDDRSGRPRGARRSRTGLHLSIPHRSGKAHLTS